MSGKNLRRAFCFAAVSLCTYHTSDATTITVANLTVGAVQAAIDNAAEGDTIVLPAGVATWTGRVTLINKSLTIRGAGIGATIITADPSVTRGLVFSVENCGAKRVDISLITWIGNTHGAALKVGGKVLDVNTNYRLHDMYFMVNSRGILLFGKCEGVVDHCTFRCTLNRTCQGITVWGAGQYPLVPGNTSASFPAGSPWTSAAVFGDSHRAFIEDCDFDFDFPNDSVVEGYYGAKYCLRHCTIKNSVVGNHGLDSGVCSTHSYEVYQNTWTNTTYVGATFEARGGTGLVWGNRLADQTGLLGVFFIKLHNYRAIGYAGAGHGASGGFITGSNPFDGNQLGFSSASGFNPCGWPALESIGTTGPITLFSGRSTCTVSPFYEWSNTYGVDLAHQTGGSQFGIPNVPVRASGNNLRIDNLANTKVTSATRNFVMPARPSPSTTIATGSNGQTLPQSTIHVASRTGFVAGGGKPLLIATSAGIEPVNYTGISGNTFTGCSGGTGRMSTGGAVGVEDTVTSDAHSWLHITGGTGFKPGWYQIVRCAGNAAILDRSPGTAGSTGGTWSEEWTPIVPSDIIKVNRDYYHNTPKPGYTPYIYPHPRIAH